MSSTSLRFTSTILTSLFFFALANTASAATLSLSPSSGSYSVGDTISVSLNVSSTDQSINAVSGTLNFPENVLQAVSVSKANSVLTLWVQEPLRSNADGTVTFAGVVPNPGFTGAGGNLITIRFLAKAAGTANISITPAETLANDGSGTNVLKGVSGATLVISEEKAKPSPSPTPPPKKEEAPKKEQQVPEEKVPTELQAPIITKVTKSVALGKIAEVTGSSIYPGADALLTLQGNNTLPLTLKVIVGENGVFSITQLHNLTPGDYIGSVVIRKDGLVSPPSGAFVIRFENKPLFLRIVEFLSQPIFLFILVILIVFIVGFFCGRYYIPLRRRIPMQDTIHEVDMAVHKAFLKLREHVNRSIAELEKESESRKLTASEERFVKEMAGTIKETEKVIEKEIHNSKK